jgi:hypothetical protein
MIEVARWFLAGGLEVVVRLLFFWLPTHIPANRWAPMGSVISCLPFTGVLIASLLLADMHAADTSTFPYRNLMRMTYCVALHAPVNILTTWLPVEVAVQLCNQAGMNYKMAYGISIVTTAVAWISVSPLAYFTALHLAESDLGAFYATAISLAAVGLAACVGLSRTPPSERDRTHTTGEGRATWVKWVVAIVGGVVVVLIAVVGNSGGASYQYALAGVFASVPLGTWAGFSVCWLQGSPKTSALKRAKRCRGALFPAAMGYRSYEIFYGLLPSLVFGFGWSSWGWAVGVAFFVSSAAVLLLGWVLYVVTSMHTERHSSEAPSDVDSSSQALLAKDLRF